MNNSALHYKLQCKYYGSVSQTRLISFFSLLKILINATRVFSFAGSETAGFSYTFYIWLQWETHFATPPNASYSPTSIAVQLPVNGTFDLAQQPERHWYKTTRSDYSCTLTAKSIKAYL